MGKVLRYSLVTALALLVLGMAAGGGSAGKLSISSQTFRLVGFEENEDGSGGARIRCPITMAGSFSARTFAKVREATVGLMTTNAINEEGCTGEGEISISENTLPIGMTYQSFEGALPNISAVHFQIPWNTIYNNLLTEPERECHYRYFTNNLSDFRH